MDQRTGQLDCHNSLDSGTIQPAYVKLIVVIRVLTVCLLLAFLTACATPYHPVYVSNSGDYYIAETESVGYYDPYYSVAPGSLSYIGAYPWWEFTYYSPYFYPYHFAVWQPVWGHGYYGWHSGYYPYWCPPYRQRVHDYPYVHTGAGDGSGDNSATTPPVLSTTVLANTDPQLYRLRYDLGQQPGTRVDSERGIMAGGSADNGQMFSSPRGLRYQPNRVSRGLQESQSTSAPAVVLSAPTVSSRSYKYPSRTTFPSGRFQPRAVIVTSTRSRSSHNSSRFSSSPSSSFSGSSSRSTSSFSGHSSSKAGVSAQDIH